MQPESEPPRVILEGVAPADGDASFSIVEIVALVAFLGTIAFCTCQAILAPRRTFCSQKME